MAGVRDCLSLAQACQVALVGRAVDTVEAEHGDGNDTEEHLNRQVDQREVAHQLGTDRSFERKGWKIHDGQDQSGNEGPDAAGF